MIFKTETGSDIVSTELCIEQVGRLYLIKEGSNAPICQNTCSLCGGGSIVPACEDATRVKKKIVI